ncbi:Ig-like domain-containing protein, partial [Arthrospira platensis SPKY1]|nr:Ig-like domain-containing protein [Arthrospira platensis SPKY1]
VKLIQDYNDAEVAITVQVSGNTVTITPQANLGNGTLHELQFLAGILSDEDQPLGVLSRTFTTAGTFSPAGLVAHWTFEDSPNDVVGAFPAKSNGVVDIAYTASRNAAAGKAASFNGTTSIIEIPNGDQLITTNDLTISFWVKTNSQGHVDANGNPKGHFVMGLGAFYGFQFEVFGGYDGAKFALRYALANGETTGEDMWMPSEATDASNGGWQGWDFARSIP